MNSIYQKENMELRKYGDFNCLEVWCPLNPLESDLIERKLVELSERIQCSSGPLSNGYKKGSQKKWGI